MKTRNATQADEANIIELWQACSLITSDNDPVHDFRFALGKPASDILVAESQGAIVGSVMVGHDGHRGWLYYVAVASQHRRQGIGCKLVQAAENWLSNHGVQKAQLMVRETNAEVAAFYRRIGYEPMPRISLQKWLKP